MYYRVKIYVKVLRQKNVIIAVLLKNPEILVCECIQNVIIVVIYTFLGWLYVNLKSYLCIINESGYFKCQKRQKMCI